MKIGVVRKSNSTDTLKASKVKNDSEVLLLGQSGPG